MRRNLPWIVGAFVLGGLILPRIHVSWQWPESAAQTEKSGLHIRPAAIHPLGADEFYSHAAQAAYKAVVNIDRTQRERVRTFFDEDYIREVPSQGSGVIVSRDGYVLTNEHVVGGKNEGARITVSLPDGRRFSGVVIGADHQTDVALVKIEGDNLPVAQVGTSRGLIPGQMAVAIGSPLGLRFTVSHGVVSALGRPVTVGDRIYSDLIQHDALINPGNSGGALVNLQGEVIGINTLVAQEAQGIGFAIPIDTALRVADELKRFGKVKRPWLGLVVMSNSGYLVQSYGLPDARGAVIRRIYRDGPTASSGLEPGDIITRINGESIKGEDDFKRVESRLRIGQKIDIMVARGDGSAKGTLTVGEAP
jgi:serine protease Do